MNTPDALARLPRFRRGGHAVVAVLCAMLVTLGALIYLWQRYQFIRLGFEVDRLRQQRADLTQQLEPLQVEADFLSRLSRIDRLARGQLGMRPPNPSQVIVVESRGATAAP